MDESGGFEYAILTTLIIGFVIGGGVFVFKYILSALSDGKPPQETVEKSKIR